jgi:hypothetical protein
MKFINKCLILFITVIMIIMNILHSIRLSQTHTHISIYIHSTLLNEYRHYYANTYVHIY